MAARAVPIKATRWPALTAPILCRHSASFTLTKPAHLNLHRGLEQSTALPADSYLQDYFADVAGLLRVGPPLILVVEGLDLTQHAHDNVTAICSVSGCDPDSLLNEVGTCVMVFSGWQGLHVSSGASDALTTRCVYRHL